MATEPIDLSVPAGLLTAVSSKSAEGRWVDGDHIRFRKGKAEKIGGWTKDIADQFEGIARGILGWTSAAGNVLVALGTTQKLYSIENALQDITPLRDSGTLTDPFSTTNASAVVNVAHTDHGEIVGARVFFSGAAAVGGLTIDGEYTVTNIVDDDNYEITAASAATSTAGPGGGDVDYEYEILPGLTDVSYGVGWGAGPYGQGTWGTPRDGSSAILLEPRTWFFGNQNDGRLLAQPFGDTLYSWDQFNSAERAVPLTNAPTAMRASFVTSENFIFALGTETPMTIQWPDRDDNTDWTPTENNTSDNRRLTDGNKLMAGTAFGSSLNLIWSDTACILAQYLDATTVVYDIRTIAKECGLVAPLAFAVTPNVVLWMSPVGIHAFSGVSVDLAPREAEIHYLLFEDATRKIDRSKSAKTWAGFNRLFNEVWFGYVSVSSPDGEPDRYVKVALEDYSWDGGSLARTSMGAISTPDGPPIMPGQDGYLYQHESGVDADGSALWAWIKSGIVSLSNGAADIDIDGYVPDFQRQSGAVTLNVFTRERPRSPSNLDSGTYTIQPTDVLVDARLSGRYIGIRLDSNVVGGDFRLGTPQLEVGQAGENR